MFSQKKTVVGCELVCTWPAYRVKSVSNSRGGRLDAPLPTLT